MQMSHATVWLVIVALAVGSFLIRFSFLGLIGARDIPEWILRHLRYTPVAVLPGLVAPLVIWPAANDGMMDPARLAAALVTLIVGYFTKNIMAAILSGAATLYGFLYLLG
jgi:branched-subunit amino acid transport protein